MILATGSNKNISRKVAIGGLCLLIIKEHVKNNLYQQNNA